jgi:hypothetical protein
LENPRISALESEGVNLNPYTRTVVFDKKSTLVSSECCPKGGKGYYEIEILIPDAKPQYGFASATFSAHATAGFDGVGDDHRSWAVDGVRKKRWHKSVDEDATKLVKELFALLDKNSNGVITLDEFRTFLKIYHVAVSQLRLELRGPNSDSDSDSDEEGDNSVDKVAQMSDSEMKEMFDDLDTDGDGKISQSELIEFFEDMFGDMNSDSGEPAPSQYNFVKCMIVQLSPGDSAYNCSWKKGDVIGLACDLEKNQIYVSVNGTFDEPNGLIFELSSDDVHEGLFAAFTGVSGKVRYNLGQTPFKHAPPSSDFKGFISFDTGRSQDTEQNDCRVPLVANTGQYAVELDLQCLELRVAGGVLRGLDDDIVQNRDVRAVLGSAVQTLQCIELRDSAVCKERKIIGTRTDVEICLWSSVAKLQPREMDREYAPLELSESELWIADLFEPIRSKLFAPPQCKEEVMFFLSDEIVPNDATCTYLSAAHPKLHGSWFQVMLIKDLATVDVWLCDSYGGQYWPSPIYTSNRIFSSFSFDPDIQDRKFAWETWGRHEAARETFKGYREELDPGTKCGFGKTCSLTRSITPLTGDGETKRRELFIPRRFLSGLIPQGLVDTYIFWQDVETPIVIRGYQVEKEGSWVDMKTVAIIIDLKRMDEDEPESNSPDVMSLEMRKIFRQRCEGTLQKIAVAVILHPKTSALLENDILLPCENGEMTLSALKAGVAALELTISESDLAALFDFLKAPGSESVCKKDLLQAIAASNWESELRAQGLDMEQTRDKVAARGIDFDTLMKCRAEVQMKKKDKIIRATGMSGVGAKVSLTKSPKSGEASQKKVLLNALQAPTGSALWSLIRTISRVEHASHVLVWGVPAENSEHRITRVELTRLKASFSVRKHTALDDTQRMLLFSDDLPGFYIVDFDELPFQAKELVQGVPEMLVLCSLQNEWLVMVPNVKAVRPQVRPRPFSCEIVFHHDDEDWKKNSEVEYFTYQLHQSGLSLLPKGLASGFYLLVLKFLGRDYQQACAMVSSISTDAALSKQEEQILELLSQTASDQHPDALACRVKIELALADCPVNLPWDIRQMAGLYFTKVCESLIKSYYSLILK